MKYILTCVLRKLLNRSLNLLPSKSYISLAQWLPISYAITSFFFFFFIWWQCGGCSVQVWSPNKRQHNSSQCILATKPLELLNMRFEKGNNGGQCNSRRGWGIWICAEKVATLLFCMWWAWWLSLQCWADEVLCHATVSSMALMKKELRKLYCCILYLAS